MLQFSEIDRRRAAASIQKKALAERAGLTPQAYTKLSSAKRGPTEQTLVKLTEALTALEAERAR